MCLTDVRRGRTLARARQATERMFSVVVVEPVPGEGPPGAVLEIQWSVPEVTWFEVTVMVQQIPSLYVSTVVPIAGGRWRGVRLPQTVATDRGALRTSGLPLGVAIAPLDASPSVRARLVVGRGPLARSVRVELELQPWSHDRVELGLRPERRLPLLVGTGRYLVAARAVVDELAAQLELEGIVLDASSAARAA